MFNIGIVDTEILKEEKMKLHITNLYGQSPLSVALIAQNLVADVAKELGFHEIGIYSFDAKCEEYSQRLVRFDGMNAAIGNGDIVVFQSPSWNGTFFDREYIEHLRVYQGIKVIIFIHDVPPLMFAGDSYLMEETIQFYNMAELLIVPSEKMLNKLRENGLTVEKILIQQMWDYPTNATLPRPNYHKLINFSGSADRFRFTKEWTFETPLHLFSPEKLEDTSINVVSHGWKFKDELLHAMAQNGGFGLVWLQTEDSSYYEWNMSYKLSTYLAAGIPVIVPSTLSNKELIEKNGLGFVVSSLEEANRLVSEVTQEEYNGLVNNISLFRHLITNGWFTKKLLLDAVHAVITTE